MISPLLAAYGAVPHHPGKGWLCDWLTQRVELPSSSQIRTRYGVRFACDLTDWCDRHIYYGGFEPRDTRALRRLIRPGQTVIDAGANVGYYSLLFASWLRGQGTVYAVEPYPETMRRLRVNLNLNPSLGVTLCTMALSDQVGSISMSVPDPANQGTNYLSEQGDVRVQTTTLDTLTAGWSRCDVIKVDVEGSEIALLRGARETIRRFRPVLVVEANCTTLGRFGFTPRDLVEEIGQYGYRFYRAGRLGLRPFVTLPDHGEPNLYAFPY